MVRSTIIGSPLWTCSNHGYQFGLSCLWYIKTTSYLIHMCLNIYNPRCSVYGIFGHFTVHDLNKKNFPCPHPPTTILIDYAWYIPMFVLAWKCVDNYVNKPPVPYLSFGAGPPLPHPLFGTGHHVLKHQKQLGCLSPGSHVDRWLSMHAPWYLFFLSLNVLIKHISKQTYFSYFISRAGNMFYVQSFQNLWFFCPISPWKFSF